MSKLSDHQIRALVRGMKKTAIALEARGDLADALTALKRIAEYETELAERAAGTRSQEPRADGRKR